MLKIGIIGAGSISKTHIECYLKNPDCKVVAIADLNDNMAKSRADEYGIEKTFSDYRDLINDEEIDAVSVLTPTFTHKQITVEALENGKHVLCEKPPALTSDEVTECKNAAKESGKCLMYAFAFRFSSQIHYLKKYIDSGKFGKVIYADASRTVRCSMLKSWFVDKKKSGGGHLMDAAIHELDALLYLMGYPKPEKVVGFTDYSNKNLPDIVKIDNPDYISADNVRCERTIESFANGHITFENGACLYIKSGNVMFTVDEDLRMELSGEKAGAKIELLSPGNKLVMVECTKDNCIERFVPDIQSVDPYQAEINHFINCCINNKECICRLDEAEMLMKILNAIYKSAETGEPVYFN